MAGKTNAELAAENKALMEQIEKLKEIESAPSDELLKKLAELQQRNKELEASNKELEKLAPKPAKSVEDFMEQKVPFYAIKDNDKYKDDLVATVNGKNYKVQRGVHLMLPRFLANIFRDSNHQSKMAANTMQGFQDSYTKGSEQLT